MRKASQTATFVNLVLMPIADSNGYTHTHACTSPRIKVIQPMYVIPQFKCKLLLFSNNHTIKGQLSTLCYLQVLYMCIYSKLCMYDLLGILNIKYAIETMPS